MRWIFFFLLGLLLQLTGQCQKDIHIKDNHAVIQNITGSGGFTVGSFTFSPTVNVAASKPSQATFKVVVNTGCTLFYDDKSLGRANVNGVFRIQFPKGQHRLKIRPNFYPDYYFNVQINVSDSLIGGEYYFDFWFDVTADLIPVKNGPNSKFQYLNIRTKEVMPNAEFDEAKFFISGLAAVRKGGKWGFFNGKKAESVNYIYDKAFDYEENIARVIVNKKFGLIDKMGSWRLMPRYDDIREFNRGLAGVALYEPDSLFDGSGRGVIDTTGSEVLSPIYSVYEHYGEDWIVTKARLVPVYKNGKLEAYDRNRKMGIVRNNKEVVPVQFEQAMINTAPSRFDEGYLYIVRSGGEYMYADNKGNFRKIDNLPYHRIYPGDKVYGGFVCATKDDQRGYLDYNFREKIPPKYESVISWRGALLVKKDGKHAFFTEKGEQLTDYLYDFYCEYYSRGWLVSREGRNIPLDSKGKEPSRADYSILGLRTYTGDGDNWLRHDPPFRIYANGKYGYIIDTTIVVPPNFDFGGDFLWGNKFTYVKKGNQYFLLMFNLVTKQFKLKLIPGNYSFMEFIDKRVLRAVINSKYRYFNSSGDCIYGCY